MSGSPVSRESLLIAVFQRCDTMPTFPSHWAACSGSIEEGETPRETCIRELQEETNLSSSTAANIVSSGGLYVDVPFRKTKERETIIRVYPFTVQLPQDFTLELRGTEHDFFKFVSVDELERLEPTVPSLARAFHHATHGKYLKQDDHSRAIMEWASDHENGAATMARNALLLVQNHGADPALIKMFRPSMVAITNAMNRVEVSDNVDSVLDSLQTTTTRTVDHAVQNLEPLLNGKTPNDPLVIATFSRSSTLAAVLQRLQQEATNNNLKVLCSKSTPGDEGILMAQDLGGVECVEDDELLNLVRNDEIDVVLVGCDCVTQQDVVNKIGTKALAEAASTSSRCKVYCCTDEWKQWDDVFPPPLEDIFEPVPKHLIDEILMPSVQECNTASSSL